MIRCMRSARWALPLLAVAVVGAGCSLPGRVSGPVTLTATFDDVGDLFVHHSVQVADVRIGSIDKIELTDDFRARVTMSVKDIDLPADQTKAILRQTSLLGEKFIELRPVGGAKAGDCPCLEDGATIELTEEAPELEFFAEETIQLLGGVIVGDVATLIDAGATGFAGRGPELNALINELGTISATLAAQSSEIVAIIDGLGAATQTLSQSNDDLDQLLVNLANATTTLADNRQVALDTLRELTRLARVQNEAVFEPYFDQVQTQIRQIDRILEAVAAGRDEVGVLLEWVDAFVAAAPLAIPNDFAQIYLWTIPCGLAEGC